MRVRLILGLCGVAAFTALYAKALLNGSLAGQQVFPVSNWWNQDISAAPVAAQSTQIIDWISGRNTTPSAVRRLHPDFEPPPYGIPHVVVSSDQPRVPLTFVAYGDESDSGSAGLPGYPIPEDARTQANYIEGVSPAAARRAIDAC